ncbi:MAG TPA: pseudouridine-5'-phosphate glycosidase, partial [Candidatus Limnocylindria bacterium]|nr:pseudouridine-5'-phosphate glycosidase [Candidatus Limnocylindria bacterium]
GAGAVPATTAVADGELVIGADRDLLERLADGSRPVAKAGSRDLGPYLASAQIASTTVSAAMRLAHLAGIRLLATGGIGGVHRDAAESHDVSSDIDELAATPVAVVCSGAKSILDLPATFELLETRRIPIVGLGVEVMPAFYAASAGLRLNHSVHDPAEAAAVVAAHQALPGAGGLLLVQPPPPEVALEAGEVEGWIEEGTQRAREQRIRGAAVTPFVLAHVAAASEGRALRANIGLIVANAAMAGRIAVALAERARA